MNISEKQALFKAGKALDAVTVSAEIAASYNISKLSETSLRKCYFEKSARMEAERVGASRNVFIGAYSYMNAGGCVRDGVFIGRYCSIGRRVTIGAGRHSVYGLSSSPSIRAGTARLYTAEERKKLGMVPDRGGVTILNNDILVGDGVVILPGVTIGTGAIIDANAVVTEDVLPYAIVGGAPAKLIRYRFPEEVIKGLLASEWWEFSPEQLQGLPTGNVFEFIETMQRMRGMPQMPFDTYLLAVK